MTKSLPGALIILSIFMALGLIIGGYFISQTLYLSKVAINTAESKGLAERRVKADRADWSVSYSVIGKTEEEVPTLYKKAEADQKIIADLLAKQGFTEDEISMGILEYGSKEYRDENQNLVDQQFYVSGSVAVSTDKVDLIEPARIAVSRLIAEGIIVRPGRPAYRFTRLNDIKPEMLKEATENARIAANEFADDAGVNVGGIRSALQGRFEIKDAAGSSSTSKIDKEVRVITTIVFYLTD
ncbi:MAG: SIMPL domain-containing protein [Verrucomicrobiota bacterium]